MVRTVVKPKGAKDIAILDPKGRNVPFQYERVERNAKGAIKEAAVVFVAETMPSLGYRTYEIVGAAKGPAAVSPR